jgi:hypothetical protein
MILLKKNKKYVEVVAVLKLNRQVDFMHNCHKKKIHATGWRN